ncbi:Sarcolemmal membrane-associated protein-like protein [Hapsidospora chrysogenum ATCC 11550]|uniref:Sarcolemmal membrane-associated protein-like protein n=1 Tax=Hapsidospora chrysogenum (strain ATCC 11550 / CBS 779.69 / DSM 880 / IAM 14645 / JCM 23072 / IMI 49137) TaxID=857340 RepID=A0A086T789_HAPC1|nr:Sarcolemmal membrane-associated protein-like protein [Hapsidospora chrysogenum ATCC 11550]
MPEAMDKPQGLTALVILTARSPYDSQFPKRRILLSKEKPTIPIGRTSKTKADVKASETNGYFNCLVMSRNHAELRMDHNTRQVFLCDVGSLHGTRHNNRALAKGESRAVSTGDTFTFGVSVDRAQTGPLPPITVETDILWQPASAQHDPPKVFMVPEDSDVEDTRASNDCRSTEAAPKVYATEAAQRVYAAAGLIPDLSTVPDDDDDESVDSIEEGRVHAPRQSNNASPSRQCVDLTSEGGDGVDSGASGDDVPRGVEDQDGAINSSSQVSFHESVVSSSLGELESSRSSVVETEEYGNESAESEEFEYADDTSQESHSGYSDYPVEEDDYREGREGEEEQVGEEEGGKDRMSTPLNSPGRSPASPWNMPFYSSPINATSRRGDGRESSTQRPDGPVQNGHADRPDSLSPLPEWAAFYSTPAQVAWVQTPGNPDIRRDYYARQDGHPVHLTQDAWTHSIRKPGQQSTWEQWEQSRTRTELVPRRRDVRTVLGLPPRVDKGAETKASICEEDETRAHLSNELVTSSAKSLDTPLGNDRLPQTSAQVPPASAQVPPAAGQVSSAFIAEMSAYQLEMPENVEGSVPESEKVSETMSRNSGRNEAASQTKTVKRKADDISESSQEEDTSTPACGQVHSSEQGPAGPVQVAPEPTQPRMASGSDLPRPPKRLRRDTGHFSHASEALSYAAKAFGYAAIGGVAVMSALIATAPAL